MSNNPFLPPGYVVPSSGGFSKIEPGDNTFRILSAPLLLWLVWENKNTRRLLYMNDRGEVSPKPQIVPGPDDSVSHVWAVKAYNYKTKRMEVLEIGSVAIQQGIARFASDPAWGNPMNYDVVITKTGTGREGTKYSFRGQPPAKASDEVRKAFEETPIDLNALLTGGDVFPQAGGAPASTQPQQTAAKVITPENWVLGDTPPAGFVVDPSTNSLKPVNDPPF